MRILLIALGLFAALPYRAFPESEANEIVDGYVAASQAQQNRLQPASMDIDIEAKLPKLRKVGHLHALRHISRLGRITYDALRFEGDRNVKNDLIARYLTAETQVQSSDSGSLAIIPANYKFKYKGQIQFQGRPVHAFQLTPRRKRAGLFKGELWIDAETYLPLRESGRWVKNPSIFLRKIEFVREYEIRDGLAVPKHIESVIDTRLVGSAELSIDFSNFTLDEAEVEASSGAGAQ